MVHWESSRSKYKLHHAASDGQLVVVKCNRCHRTIHFLAVDLVNFVSPERDARDPPFPCSKCGKTDLIKVELRLPSSGDYGDLWVRRPGPIRRIQTWRTVRLGDE